MFASSPLRPALLFSLPVPSLILPVGWAASLLPALVSVPRFPFRTRTIRFLLCFTFARVSFCFPHAHEDLASACLLLTMDAARAQTQRFGRSPHIPEAKCYTHALTKGNKSVQQ
jgi:hypothetical protein